MKRSPPINLSSWPKFLAHFGHAGLLGAQRVSVRGIYSELTRSLLRFGTSRPLPGKRRRPGQGSPEFFPLFFGQTDRISVWNVRAIRRISVLALTGGQEADAMGAPVLLVRFTFHESRCCHPLQQRSHGVGIARHQQGQFPLSQLLGIALQQGAQDGELVGRHAGVQCGGGRPGSSRAKRGAARAAAAAGESSGSELASKNFQAAAWSLSSGSRNYTCKYYFVCNLFCGGE